MPSAFEIITAIRRLRNDIMATRRRGNAREDLKYQCDKISELDMPGQDWASQDMPDPLFPDEKGHSVRVVRTKGKHGVIVSLTGKKILGHTSDVTDEISVREQLEKITGARNWIPKKNTYTKR